MCIKQKTYDLNLFETQGEKSIHINLWLQHLIILQVITWVLINELWEPWSRQYKRIITLSTLPHLKFTDLKVSFSVWLCCSRNSPKVTNTCEKILPACKETLSNLLLCGVRDGSNRTCVLPMMHWAYLDSFSVDSSVIISWTESQSWCFLYLTNAPLKSIIGISH